MTPLVIRTTRAKSTIGSIRQLHGGIGTWRRRAIKDVEWSFQENALSVALKARTDLNIFDGAPHTLRLKVIQLSDASAFKTLAQSVGGVRAMLTQSQEMIRWGGI
jgi:hypothetical protein